MNKQFIQTTVTEALRELSQLHAHHYRDCEGGCPAEQAIQNLQKVVAMLSEENDIVDVAYWDSNTYQDSTCVDSKPFKMKIDDQRHCNGQLYVDLMGPTLEFGNEHDIMSAIVEVHQLPGSEINMQCLHLHFDDSRLAASFFKLGNKIILRPEKDVLIERFALPDGELGYILNGGNMEKTNFQGTGDEWKSYMNIVHGKLASSSENTVAIMDGNFAVVIDDNLYFGAINIDESLDTGSLCVPESNDWEDGWKKNIDAWLENPVYMTITPEILTALRKSF
jgi:hypothetical protein